MRDTMSLFVIDPAGAQLDTVGVWAADEGANYAFSGGVTRREGQVAVPAGSRLLDAAGDRVAMLRRGEMDEEYVVVTRLAPGT